MEEPVKRSRLHPASANRVAENALRRERMLGHFGERDEWACQFAEFRERVPLLPIAAGPCFAEVHGHEILKRSRGGSITDISNIILLCNFHNCWLEDHPHLAAELGLAKHSWEQS